jgi:predicted PurR-regulated permease PerM
VVVAGRGSPEPVDPPTGETARARLRRVGELCLWSLVVGAAVLAVLYVASLLRLVVLPVLLAIVLSTFLTPPVRWLEAHGWRSAAAAITVLLTALVVLGAVVAVLVPVALDEFSELDVGVTGSIDSVQAWLRDTLPFSAHEISDALDRLQEQVGTSLDALAGRLVGGAFVALEVVTGLVLAVVVLFFVLKDGRRIWDWLVGLVTPSRRDDMREIGDRAWHALAGFVRGQTLVALFDAVLIGSAIAIIGVPLALPLAVLTFFGAYVPVIGATITGLLAVLVALASEGLVAAIAVLAAILVVQQIEGNVFQPVVVGRAVDVHPLAILLGVTAGGVLAGIIGAMIAAPIVAVAAAVLRYVREQSEEP